MASQLERDIAQLFVGGFDDANRGAFEDLVRRGRVGGAILFRRNLGGDLGAVRAQNQWLESLASDEPLLIALDQEGGRVQRLRDPFPELPPMRALGDQGDPEVCREAGASIGRALRNLGFDQDYAPVLDVDSNPANPVIGDRAFSADPVAVAELAVAFAEGLESAGVASCGKHFPGHGDTSQDSHLLLPRLPHDRARLDAVELVPFAAAARAGIASIMTAHVVFDAVEPGPPATLSRPALSILRQELGFEGVIVSDDLEMRAIADHQGVSEAAVAAIGAGCDQLLVCHHPERLEAAFEAIRAAVEKGALEPERVAEAAERVRRMKARFCRPTSSEATLDLGGPAHARLLERIGAGSGSAGRDPTEDVAEG